VSELRVRAPASSANLGPGFDSFAIALPLLAEFEVRPARAWAVSLDGDGEERAPEDDLFVIAARAVARAAKEHAAILKAIARRDQKALLSAVREHIEAGWSELDRKIDAHPELSNSSQKTAA
jgi:DNA-binding GntR family transcriptional regulator